MPSLPPPKIPARGIAREIVLSVGGVAILVTVALHGELPASTAIVIALALLGVGPGATVTEAVLHTDEKPPVKSK